jgi:hypothetical protein
LASEFELEQRAIELEQRALAQAMMLSFLMIAV